MEAVREGLSNEVTRGPSWRHRGLTMCRGKLRLLGRPDTKAGRVQLGTGRAGLSDAPCPPPALPAFC